MTETQNHSDTDQGGSVRYHRAEWVGHKDARYPWRVQFTPDDSLRDFTAQQAEAMGLTPPPPPEPDWDDLPVGSEVEDCDGNRWVRFHNGWAMSVTERRVSKFDPAWSPYTVTHRHQPEVTLEQALRRIGYSDTDIRSHAVRGSDSIYVTEAARILVEAARAVVAEWDAK